MAERLVEIGPGRQALGLLIGVVASFLVATAVALPFDLDVGAGHAIFHLVFAVGLGATAGWLWRNRGAGDAVALRLALWSSAALAVAQFIEGIVAIPDAEGESAAHGIPNVATLILQLLILVSLLMLAVSALLRRRSAPR